MVDTTNNTAANNEEQNQNSENPQSILEKRLAEINARKNEAPAKPAEEPKSSGSLMSGAVATHEVMPPAPVVSTTENTEAAKPSQVMPPAPDADKTLPITNELTPVQPSAPETTAETDRTNDLSAVPYNLITPVKTDEEATKSETDLSAATAIAPNQKDSTTTIAPEAMSTAGIISDPLGVSTEQVTSTDLEAATMPSTTTDPTPASEVPVVSENEMLMDDDHQEELVPETDYSNLSTTDVRQKLVQLAKSATRQQGRQVHDLHRQYEAKLAVDKADALDKFIAEGGNADDFEYQPGPEHQEAEKAYQQFRDLRNREQRQDEEQKVKNAKRKQELLDALRDLVESPETKSSSDKIRQIQTEWKNIGPVPATDSKQLWNSYHALLDIFYNNRSIFYELKELDRRKNLQHKIQLCERAESLLEQPSINTALQELRNLHEEWKNVGPVPNEFRDSIWERFIQASEKVHARKKDFINERKGVEQENLVKKTDLLTRMEVFQNFQTDRINDWRDKTDEIQKLKEEWDAVGLVPKDKADEVNKRFWSTYKAFFNHKNAFFKNLDEQKMHNLKLKTELCEQAESLKDSNDWDETKETLIQLQKKWKTIGRVPDKFSEKLWQRFRSACNEFFDRKQNEVQQRETEINQASQVKTTYFEQLATRITTLNTDPGNFGEYERLRDQWLALPVNRNITKLDDRYFDLLQKYVGSISDLSTDEKDNVLAELQVTRFKQAPDAQSRIHQKEQAIKRDILQLENDIRTLKTNIEFFGRSRNAEKLREEYQARIAEADHRIQQLQRQLVVFRNI